MTRLLPPVCAAILLAACVHTGDIDDGLNYTQRQARLSAVGDWDLRGRLAIETEDEGHVVRVRWRQRDERLELEVRGGPFGIAGGFRIAGDADALTIEDGDETRTLDDPEIGLSNELGWWLPVTSLEFWLLGRPDEAFPRRMDRGPAGTLAALEQRDWRIVYDEYRLADGLLIPRRLTLTHATLELTLIVSSWAPAGS